jgi:hypothetical protein
MTATPANVPASQKIKSPKLAGLYCRASWHLRHNSNAAVVYALALSITEGGKATVHLSHRQVATYYGWGLSKTSAAFKDCEDAGLFVRVQTGKGGGRPGRNSFANEYLVKTHQELAVAHPQYCLGPGTVPPTERLKRRRSVNSGRKRSTNRTALFQPQNGTVPPTEQEPFHQRNPVFGVGSVDESVEGSVVENSPNSKPKPTPQLSTPKPKTRTTGMGKSTSTPGRVKEIAQGIGWIEARLAEKGYRLPDFYRDLAQKRLAEGISPAGFLDGLLVSVKYSPQQFAPVEGVHLL